MTQLSVNAALAAVVCLAGCYRAATSDGGDAGDDTDTWPEGYDPDLHHGPCTAVFGHPCGVLGDELFPVELEAADLAGDWELRFTGMQGFQAILAERDDGSGSEPVVIIADPELHDGTVWPFIAVPPPDAHEDLEPVGIALDQGLWSSFEGELRYDVLLCEPTACSIWGVPTPESDPDPDTYETDGQTGLLTLTMQLLDSIDIAEGLDLRGIPSRITAPYGDTVFVYGDGIYSVSASGWIQEVPPDSGGFLNDMTLEHAAMGQGMAVGDDGRMIQWRFDDETWQEVPTETQDDLRFVVRTGIGYYAAGENGAVSFLGNVYPEQEVAHSTSIASEDITMLRLHLHFDDPVEEPFPTELSGFSESGCAFYPLFYEPSPCWGVPALDGPLIGWGQWGIQDVASGRFFLTETALYRYTVYDY